MYVCLLSFLCIGMPLNVFGTTWYYHVDKTAEAVLPAAARKEIAYLERFGRPLLPFKRERREAYEYKEQSPLDHIKNLERYLLMAPLIVPTDRSLHAFCMRHPDLQPNNIMVSTSPNSGKLEIVSLIDWQHASILPRFLNAGIPDRFQNYDDPYSQYLIPPIYPHNADKMEKSELKAALQVYNDRLVHFHYVMATEKLNKTHHDALEDYMSLHIRRLSYYSGVPWEAETHDLKALLIEATEQWEELAGAGVPCPVEFDPDDVRKTKEFSERLQIVEEYMEKIRVAIGYGTDTWVPVDHYRKAKDLAESLKLRVLKELPEGEQREIFQANWMLDDMPDEGNYM